MGWGGGKGASIASRQRFWERSAGKCQQAKSRERTRHRHTTHTHFCAFCPTLDGGGGTCVQHVCEIAPPHTHTLPCPAHARAHGLARSRMSPRPAPPTSHASTTHTWEPDRQNSSPVAGRGKGVQDVKPPSRLLSSLTASHFQLDSFLLLVSSTRKSGRLFQRAGEGCLSGDQRGFVQLVRVL